MGVSASECLREGCPPPTNVTVKEFARWYCKSRPGRLNKEPTLASLDNVLQRFFKGFEQATGTPIGKEFRNDIYLVCISPYDMFQRPPLLT